MHLFSDFLTNLKRIFAGKNLIWFLAAVASSLMAVYSGFDWIWFTRMHDTFVYGGAFPIIMAGSFVPIFGILIYLAVSAVFRNKEQVRNAWALGQAALLGFVISTAIKAFTGRIPPPHAIVQGMADISHGFQFGFLRGGVFWGWPSSHTTVAFAMAAALIALYPKKAAVRYVALIYALSIGIAVSVSIHWFSEFIAGALIGWAIGKVVGASFHNRAITEAV